MSTLHEDYLHVRRRLEQDVRAAFELAEESKVYVFPSAKVNDREFAVIERSDRGIDWAPLSPVYDRAGLPFRITVVKPTASVAGGTNGGGELVDAEKVRLAHRFHDLFCVAHYGDQGAGQPFRGCWGSMITGCLGVVDDPEKPYFTIDMDVIAYIAVARGDYAG